MLDVDGTLTDQKKETIPDYLGRFLADFSETTPLAICTGRRLDLLTSKMDPVWKHAKDLNRCKKNWMFFCENGAIGYEYDAELNDYRDFYSVNFPFSEEKRVQLFERLKSAMEGKISQAYMNNVTLVFAPVSRGSGDLELTAKESHELAEIASPIIQEFDSKGAITIGDSGMAINIVPRDGDKDRAVYQYGQYLQRKFRFNMSENFKEIVCVGDQPQPGCNDEKFLSGKYGTPFTVGEVYPENESLNVVTDNDGNILKGPRGTLYLLQNLKSVTTD